MAEIDRSTGLPTRELRIDGDSPRCSECNHPAIIAPRRGSLFRRILRLKPRRAECQVRDLDLDPSGLTPLPCGCRNAVHGS
jgi:hypothetical protein